MAAFRNQFNKSPWRWLAVAALVIVAVALLIHPSKSSPKAPITAYTQLTSRINEGKIKSLTFDPNNLTITVYEKSKSVPSYTLGVPSLVGSNGLQEILDAANKDNVPVTSIPYGQTSISGIFLKYLPTLIFLLIILYFFRQYLPGGGNKVQAAKSETTFDDVAGCGEAIEELQDVRSFLNDPKKYARLGAQVPKGVLLHGPPGTGKTLLAKAVASEAGIPFYHISGAEFVEMFAGLGARRVRQLFKTAKKSSPAIIFIDELDSIGGTRSSGGGDGATREGDQTLNQLLTEMDGFNVSTNPVILIGATNRLDTLDSALLRPGRFDRLIAIDPPDKRGREEILKVHARNKRLNDDVNLAEMATHSSGMSGAQLAQWLNEAALMAARHDHESVTAADIDDAFFRIVAGAKKQYRSLSEKERQIVAYHESGHAIVGEALKSAEKVHKISIIPRGQSGGQTIRVSEEDVFLYSRQAMRDIIAMLLAGRASEELTFQDITSGAADDLKRATELAVNMVTQFGMSENLGLRVTSHSESEISPELKAQIDQEVKTLLETEHERAIKILTDEKISLDKIAQTLLKEETLNRERFIELIDLKDQEEQKD